MKRTGRLIEAAADMDNLREAFWRAARRIQRSLDMRQYESHLDENLSHLRAALLAGTHAYGNYRVFKVYEKKERSICAAPFRDRVAHHALMRVCDPVFERHQLFDSYASRMGKGTYAALDRARHFSGKFPWYLKLDVRKYFDSISHPVLKAQLRRLFKDSCLLGHLDAIIDSYQSAPGRGVPIGNLTSQYFANHVLSKADHFAKEALHVPGYARYMDDMVLWDSHKSGLLEKGRRFEEFIRDTLHLDLKTPCLNRSSRGLGFLGFKVFGTHVLLDHRSRERYRARLFDLLEALEAGALDETVCSRRIAALAAHTEHASAHGFRRKVLSDFGCHPWVRSA